MNKLPKTRARFGWIILPDRLQETCDFLGIKYPVHIRYQSGKYTVGTHRSVEDAKGNPIHKITLNQNKEMGFTNQTLFHELVHAKQAEQFHRRTGKKITMFYREDYLKNMGPHGVAYWRNKYEVEARELTENFADERMMIAMPDHYGFNHLPNWGVIRVECVECDVGGSLGQWPEEKRKEHFASHVSLGELKPKRKRRTKAEMEAALLAAREKKLERQKRKEEGRPSVDYYIDDNGMRVQDCISCGQSFVQERRRGRPKIQCDNCRGDENGS